MKRQLEEEGGSVDGDPAYASHVLPPSKKAKVSVKCPYLDTINRQLLDFDFEKVCSVTLSNLNVYACLICGKYFQGRASNSPAHFHSLQANHHVFINLNNMKVYCLPDDYEVVDSSLDDIKYFLNPTFTPEQVAALDSNTTPSRALDGTEFLPGIVGLNNIKHNDAINVILHALSHVKPLRDFFLLSPSLANTTNSSPLLQRFGELIRKMWNPRNFKSHVSPHEVLQAITQASNKKFRIGERCDAKDFLVWFLNTLHNDLIQPQPHDAMKKSTKKPPTSIIHRTFQGEVEITTFTASGVAMDDVSSNEKLSAVSTTKQPFLFLTLDLPPPPLFRGSTIEDAGINKVDLIAQVPLYTLLSKFSGTPQRVAAAKGGAGSADQWKGYRLTKLPPYIIIHIKRFTKNAWFVEKNPTIVNFPLKHLDLKEYYKPPENAQKGESTKYDLVANVCHDGKPESGSYRVHLRNKANDQWYEVQDLSVREAMPQLIVLSESYIMVYEQQQQ